MLLTQQVAKDKILNTNEMNEKGLDINLNITNNQCCTCTGWQQQGSESALRGPYSSI